MILFKRPLSFLITNAKYIHKVDYIRLDKIMEVGKRKKSRKFTEN